MWRKKVEKIAYLAAISIALCERVCYPKPTWKKLNGFTPNQILLAHHLNALKGREGCGLVKMFKMWNFGIGYKVL